jgi:glutathione S-transferase
MSDIKLYYYQAGGAMDQIRFICAYAGQQFTNCHPEGADPSAFLAECRTKGGNLTTNVPMAEVDGKFYTQSKAIVRMLARKFNLMPSDAEGLYEVDNLLEHDQDFRKTGYTVLHIPMFGMAATAEAAAAGKAKMATAFANYARLLGEKDYFVGDGKTATVADIVLYEGLFNFGAMFPDLVEPHANLVAFKSRMASNPNLAAYLAGEQHNSVFHFSSEHLPPTE